VISAHFPAKLFIVSAVAPGVPVTELIDFFDIVLSVIYLMDLEEARLQSRDPPAVVPGQLGD
jgi:hypothetical protein